MQRLLARSLIFRKPFHNNNLRTLSGVSPQFGLRFAFPGMYEKSNSRLPAVVCNGPPSSLRSLASDRPRLGAGDLAFAADPVRAGTYVGKATRSLATTASGRRGRPSIRGGNFWLGLFFVNNCSQVGRSAHEFLKNNPPLGTKAGYSSH